MTFLLNISWVEALGSVQETLHSAPVDQIQDVVSFPCKCGRCLMHYVELRAVVSYT